MTDDEDDVRFGEMVAGERHYPEYTKGCWGKHGHKLCWLCKIRVPVKLLKLTWRLRRQS